MIFSTALQVTEIDNNTIKGWELWGIRQKLEIEYNGGVEVKPGDQIILTGEITETGLVAHNNVSIRRFLEPLNEEELFEAAARFKMVQPINDPFPAKFKQLKPLAEKIMETDDQAPEAIAILISEREEFHQEEQDEF